MNKKKLFGVLASASMLLNATPLSVFAEEMVETGPSGTLTGVDSSNVALNSTNFPDDNLLTAIKNQNPTATTADGVKNLMIQGSAVKSLEGLQYLTELQSFALINNDNISTLDLSNNTKLNGGAGTVTLPNTWVVDPLYIEGNGALTSITLPEDEDLKALTIIGNAGLDDLNLAPCALLEDVNLSGNSLDTLNLSGNVYLQNLYVRDNDLYQLDATPCKQLNNLDVSFNKIYELKVPTAIPNALRNLDAESNKLQTFDGSGLKGLMNLNLSWNMLNSIVLPSGPFQELNLAYNHLAALNLKKINFAENANVAITPQYLYANVTDKAVNIKDYDANFNPDQAKLPNDKDFSDDSIFNIPEVPGEASKAEFTNNNTKVVVTVNPDGMISVEVLLNDVPVNASNYVLTPDLTSLSPEEIKALNSVTVTGKGNCIGEAVVKPTVNDGTTPAIEPVTMTKENTTVTYTENKTTNAALVTEMGEEVQEANEVALSANDIRVYSQEALNGAIEPYAIGFQLADGTWENVLYSDISSTDASIKPNSDPSTFTVAFTISSATILATKATEAAKLYSELISPAPFKFENVTAVPVEDVTATNTKAVLNSDGDEVSELKMGDLTVAAAKLYTNPSSLSLTGTAPNQTVNLIPFTISNKGVAALPYIIPEGTTVENVPCITAVEAATELTADNTRVVYNGTATTIAANSTVYLQVLIDGEWKNLGICSTYSSIATTTTITDNTPIDFTLVDSLGDNTGASGGKTLTLKGLATPTSAELKLGTDAQEPLAALGYKITSTKGLLNVPTSAITPLTPKNTRILYTLDEKTDAPIWQKVQVWTGEGTPDFASNDGWTTIGTQDQIASDGLFDIKSGSLKEPVGDSTVGSAEMKKGTDTSGFPAEYALDNTTYVTFPAVLESPEEEKKLNIGETDQVATVTLSLDDQGVPTLTITPAGEGATPTTITGADKIAEGFAVTQNGNPVDWSTIKDGDTVTVTALDANETYEGTKDVTVSSTPTSTKTDIGDDTQVASVALSLADGGTLTITPAGEGATPVQITGDDILAGFDIIKEGETTPITSLDQLVAGDKVIITAKDTNTDYEGTASNIEVTDTPVTPPVEEDEYTITSITIKKDDGTTIEVPTPNAYFELTDVDTTNNTGTLSYREDTPQSIKDTYVIENGTSLSDVPATEKASEEDPQAAMMSEYAPANASTSYYIYSTLVQNDIPNAISMQVWIQKEDLMNRLYNPNSGEHFYTKDTHEKDVLVSLGWQYEGIGWVAPTAAQSSIPVYRLYNPNAGDHHYTKDPNEKDTLVRAGWSYEGIGWYSAYDGTSGSDDAQGGRSIEVFREYNPNAKAAGAHNYTINEIENSVLTSIGWLDEGIAWWAIK